MTQNTAPKINILSAVICDDVRVENNGKEILIGVYSGAITVHMIPSLPLSLKCWMNLSMEGPCVVKLQFRATDNNNEEIFRAEVETGTNENTGMGSIAFGPILFTLRDPEGHLAIDYKEGEGDWSNVITKSARYQSQ